MNRPRIGLLVPFVSFYEPIIALRAEKEAFAARVKALLEEHCEVIGGGLVCSEEDARRAGKEFAENHVVAVVVAPSVAVFGALPWAALEPIGVPVCIWSLQPAPAIPTDYNIRELIRNSGGLGVQALANTLSRAERYFEVVFSIQEEKIPRKLTQFLQTVGILGSLWRARFGQIGTVFPQMTDVQMDHSAWPGTPITGVSPRQLTMEYQNQPSSAVSALVEEIRQLPSTGITDDELRRSARLSLALDAIVDNFGLSGGALNCHGENCLKNPEIGVTACYAVSEQTSKGRPFSCTGDLPTAIALWIIRQLAGSVIYAELDLVDSGSDTVLLANGGEGDWEAAAGTVTIVGNENFVGLHGRGASLRFEPFAGPATLLSFTPIAKNQYRLVMADGELVRIRLEKLGVFHAAFRFRQLPAGTAFEQWCEAGAVHHLAVGPGHWSGHLKRLASMAKWNAIAIGDSNET
jgi:L-arabinose isomerase